jgi:transposase-like protein
MAQRDRASVPAPYPTGRRGDSRCVPGRDEYTSDQGALAPLLRGGPLSKDAVSRLVGRLREDFETWRTRDLADEDIRYVFMVGWYPNLRIGGRRVRVPVLVTLGVRANGERVVLDLRLAGEESGIRSQRNPLNEPLNCRPLGD